ncbi:hypothetical protein KY332_03605 [Candidatus Woesearchaeota archaeon]|nr:hypothetical protein [Candidatus Woesearchaeota archaeon]
MYAQIVGWIPAIILPTATAIQLGKIWKLKNAEGVSITTWLLLAFANTGLYIFTEKYFVVQAVLACLVTAILDVIIVLSILYYRK